MRNLHAESLNIIWLLSPAKSGKVFRATFIFDVLWQKFVTLVRMWLFLKIKNIFNLWKTCLFRTVQKFFTPQISIIQFKHFDLISLKFRKKETVQYLLKTFYMETRLSHGLLHYMELLKKMFPIILNMENANRVQKDFFSK